VSTGLETLSRQSVVDTALEQLQLKILHGDFKPGEKLPTEQALTAALGVSRSTLREALNRLASLRLIHIQHGGSKTVLDYREHAGLEVLPILLADRSGYVDLELVRAITELRSILAPDAARLAATRRDSDSAERLLRAAEAMAVPDLDLDSLTERSNYFWKQLVLASDNLAYRLSYNSLQSSYVDHAAAFRQIIEPELRAVERYRAIATAIDQQNVSRAVDETRALVALGAGLIVGAIREVEASMGGGR
jgi:GntR family transcriptional repressor for pyruvate dehydrogenase complex